MGRSKHVKSRPQIVDPQTSFMDFQKRDRVKLTSNTRLREKEERARDFLDSLKSGERGNKINHKKDYSECLQGDPLYRKMYREQADDDALLGSVSNYLDSVRAEEIKFEDAYGLNEPIVNRKRQPVKNNSDSERKLEYGRKSLNATKNEEEIEENEPFVWHRVKVPDRNLAGSTLDE